MISFKYSLFVLIDFFAKTATPYHLLVDNLKKAIKTANSNIYFVFLEAGNTIKLPEKVMFHLFSHCPTVLSNLGQIYLLVFQKMKRIIIIIFFIIMKKSSTIWKS